MYSQANVREESVLRSPTRALPSVIVDTEKVLREADGPEESDFHEEVCLGWKGVRTWVRLKERTGEPARSPKNTSAGATVRFASSMDICHLKNDELEAKHQKYKGRVVLRGDIVKYNSGFYAVFTEQGSSASQMTAAKIMDIISRLPGCDRQAADAVSAYTQVKMEDAHKLLKIPKSECPDIWIRLPRHKWPKSWSNMEDPVVPLEKEICTVILWQDYCGKGNLRTSY